MRRTEPIKINSRNYSETYHSLSNIIERFQNDVVHYPQQLPCNMAGFILQELAAAQDKITIDSRRSRVVARKERAAAQDDIAIDKIRVRVAARKAIR